MERADEATTWYHGGVRGDGGGARDGGLNWSSQHLECEELLWLLAETINGFCKTELIRRRGPWRTVEQVELEATYCAHHRAQQVAELSTREVSGHTGAVHPPQQTPVPQDP